MKIDLQNIKKGAESVDLYLQRIKDCREQLAVVGVVISDEDIVIVALRGLPPEYNTIKAIIRGRENLVSLKELRSQLKDEEATLDEGFKQPRMTAMYANGSGSTYELGGPSGAKPSSEVFPHGSSSCQFSPGPQMVQGVQMSNLVHMPHTTQMGQMPQYTQFQQLPFSSPTGPYAFVSQTGSGTYNNFRGNNFKYKGKGKKFHSGFQGPYPHSQSQTNFQNFNPQMSPVPPYNLMLLCQICDKKGHSTLHCFQRGCQICNRVGHTTSTCFDRGNSNASVSMYSPQPMYSSQFQAPGLQVQCPGSNMTSQYISNSSVAQRAPSPVAFPARTNPAMIP